VTNIAPIPEHKLSFNTHEQVKFKTLNSFTLLILATLFLFFWKQPGFWLSFALLGLVYFTLLAIGVFNLSLAFFAPAITRGESDTIYLTYDDGPHPTHTPALLALLATHELPASFFVIGQQAERHPELLRELSEKGHFIGNHSYSHHLFFQFWSTRKVTEDLDACRKLIAEVQHPARKAFRPPIGIMNPNIARAALTHRYPIIGWNNRSLDTKTTDIDVLWKRVKANLEQGQTLILMHDNREISIALTEKIIYWGKEKGMKFATVETLLS
jgi:peptidoglycan-N-acetylglucosamine deacetylase